MTNLRCGFLAADEIMIKSALPYSTDPDGHHERRLRGKEGELRTLPAIRLGRRDQQGSRHIPSGRSASSIDAFPRKVNGFLTRFAILCARKASSESPLWLHLKSRQ